MVIDADGKRRRSRRMDNDEAALLALAFDVLELSDGDPVTWAIDLHAGGATLMIALLADNGQQVIYIPGRTVHHASSSYRGDGKGRTDDITPFDRPDGPAAWRPPIASTPPAGPCPASPPDAAHPLCLIRTGAPRPTPASSPRPGLRARTRGSGRSHSSSWSATERQGRTTGRAGRPRRTSPGRSRPISNGGGWTR
ncbi:transposase [Streptomyces sp. YIM 132580]|nr:transposase [Streptomyces sp. YIM 132580]